LATIVFHSPKRHSKSNYAAIKWLNGTSIVLFGDVFYFAGNISQQQQPNSGTVGAAVVFSQLLEFNYPSAQQQNPCILCVHLTIHEQKVVRAFIP
jgi:hypothetical protein